MNTQDINLSFVVIGRNSHATLEGCINSIKLAASKCNKIHQFEIIYIDSNSDDDSVKIARDNDVDIIEILKGYTSAAAGRFLGKIYARNEHLVFIDSDMYLMEEWFNECIEYYLQYDALIGDRLEHIINKNGGRRVINKFYNFKKVSSTRKIGGFLMINKSKINNINYSPLLKNEEEVDFYAKFYRKLKVFAVPNVAYLHNNRTTINNKINDYINPFKKNGFIISFMSSVKNNYFLQLLDLQKDYAIRVSSSILFYSLLVGGEYALSMVVLFGVHAYKPKRFLAGILTTIFFPLKLIGVIVLLLSGPSLNYSRNGVKYSLRLVL
jgi:hypothetical protein